MTRTSWVHVSGFDATTGGGLGISGAANNWAADTDIDAAVTDLDSGLDTLRTNAKTMASNLDIVNTRQDFTTNLINTLTGGRTISLLPT